MVKDNKHFGEFGYKQVERKAMEMGQFSTPLHIAELMILLPIPKEQLRYNEKGEVDDSSYEWYKDKLVYEPCVGTGNLFWPLKDKGIILIGNDIDVPSLETCKQRIPEAILTNCNTFLCVNPKLVIKSSEKAIVELSEELEQLLQKETRDKKENSRIKVIPKEIEIRKKAIEESKRVKAWKYGLYCSEHVFHEPKETIKRLENKLWKDHVEFMEQVKKLRQETLQKERDAKNNGQPIWYNCHRCNKKMMDENVGMCKCKGKIKHLLCEDCAKQSWGVREDGRLDTRELDISDLEQVIQDKKNGKEK